jgi:hypothetical protein
MASTWHREYATGVISSSYIIRLVTVNFNVINPSYNGLNLKLE